MMDFKWRYRWVNPAWLWSAFSPAYWARRDITAKVTNDN